MNTGPEGNASPRRAPTLRATLPLVRGLFSACQSRVAVALIAAGCGGQSLRRTGNEGPSRGGSGFDDDVIGGTAGATMGGLGGASGMAQGGSAGAAGSAGRDEVVVPNCRSDSPLVTPYRERRWLALEAWQANRPGLFLLEMTPNGPENLTRLADFSLEGWRGWSGDARSGRSAGTTRTRLLHLVSRGRELLAPGSRVSRDRRRRYGQRKSRHGSR